MGSRAACTTASVVQNHSIKIKILGVPEFAPPGSAGLH
jgi:hypothetical protein